MKVATTILIILTLALGGTLFYQHSKAAKIKKQDDTTINTLSNNLNVTQTKLQEQQDVNDRLSKTLNVREKDLSEVSNKYVTVSSALDVEKQKFQNASATIEKMKLDIAAKDKQIGDLEKKQGEYTKKMEDLTLNIETLGKQIADTQKKLDASEGDREFLIKELKRMQAEKAELERQFNDLSVLRTQVAKLKDELSIARRLEWIRMGIYGSQEKKGAEILAATMQPGGTKPRMDLNVELKTDGTATVVAPATNTPPPAPK